MLAADIAAQPAQVGLLGQTVLGIVTGIFTSLLIFAAKKLFTSVVVPFWREQRYQGVDIDGQWYGEGTDEEGETQIALKITQSAHQISGDVRLTYVSAAKSFELRFNITGHVWEGYVSVNFLPADKRFTSYAAGLLKITEGGISLTGIMAYRHATNELVDSIRVYLTRTPMTEARREVMRRRQRELWAGNQHANDVDPTGFAEHEIAARPSPEPEAK